MPVATSLRELAPDVWMLSLLPLGNLNAYLVGDVVVDSGLPLTRRRFLRVLSDRVVTAHVLTHAHPDHQGASHALCVQRAVPLWCGAADRNAAESGSFHSVSRPGAAAYLAGLFGGPGHEVNRTLSDGDRVADFEVLATPGHTPGHISLWRQRDGLMILGDVAFHRNPVTFRSGLREPFYSATYDPVTNRRSLRLLADLRPTIVCFGHGEPVQGDRFAEWAARLPNP